MTKTWISKKNHGIKVKRKLRSGLEDRIAAQLEEAGVEYHYEKLKLTYTVDHSYTPDFHLPNGIIVEGKGLFDSAARSKHLAIQKAYPGFDIRFVFSRSSSPLYKGSKTTYADWCKKHGFKYADKLIPSEWLDE